MCKWIWSQGTYIKFQRYIHNDNDQFSMNSTNDFHSMLSIYASLRHVHLHLHGHVHLQVEGVVISWSSIPWLLTRNLLCLYQFWIKENFVQTSLQDKINHEIVTSQDSYIKITSYKFAIKKVAMIYEEIQGKDKIVKKLFTKGSN